MTLPLHVQEDAEDHSSTRGEAQREPPDEEETDMDTTTSDPPRRIRSTSHEAEEGGPNDEPNHDDYLSPQQQQEPQHTSIIIWTPEELRQRQKRRECYVTLGIAALIIGITAPLALSQSSRSQTSDDNISTLQVATLLEDGASIIQSIHTDTDHSCALYENGSVQCWGSQIYVPPNLRALKDGSVQDPVQQVAVGDGFTCALLLLQKENGTLQCWGDDRAADFIQPPDAMQGDDVSINFITASGGTICAISSTLSMCWGFDRQGRVSLEIPSTSSSFQEIATPQNGNLEHVCGIHKETAAVTCYASNMNLFTLEEVSLRGDDKDGNSFPSTVQSVAVMTDYVCVVGKEDGGLLSCRPFEDDASSNAILPNLTDQSNIAYSQVIAGPGNSFCAIQAQDGTVDCFGPEALLPSNRIPATVGGLSQLSIGTRQMCGIRLDFGFGTCWGAAPRPGQLKPLQDPTMVYATQIAGGERRSCAIDWYRPMVECWGRKQYQLIVRASDISIGNVVTCVVDASDQYAKCVVGDATFVLDNVQVERVLVSRKQDVVCTLDLEQRARCFRIYCQQGLFRNTFNCQAVGYRFGVVGGVDRTSTALSGSLVDIQMNDFHYCTINVERQIACGILDGNVNATAYPQAQVPDDVGGVRDMALGQFFTCVVQEDFTVRCWGEAAQYGQEFVLETPLGGYYRSIAATDQEVCAITMDDFVHCWGRPFSNTLYIPESVRSVQQLVAGSDHFCALLQDQQVVCWGSNQFGELSPDYN